MKLQTWAIQWTIVTVLAFLCAACNVPPQPTVTRSLPTTTPTPAPSPTALSTPAVSATPTLDLNGPMPPSIIKNIGFDWAEIDMDTGRAGDILITGVQPYFGKIILDYGEIIPESSEGKPKLNLQPAFYLPLGTKVRSIIDGVVVSIPTLWSGDYSVMIAPRPDSKYIWEMEHVLNPVVKVGDYVTAGQIIAEVSNFQSQNNPNLGAVEIGLLEGGNPPRHHCPFLYLDPSVKLQVENWLMELRAAWEQVQGNADIYDEDAYATPGCRITDPIEG